MPEKQATKVVAIILIIIAAVLVLGPFSMWMMPSMMGGMMGGCRYVHCGPAAVGGNPNRYGGRAPT